MLVLVRIGVRAGGQAVVPEILLGPPDIGPGRSQFLLGRAQLGPDPFEFLRRERLVGHQALGARRRRPRVVHFGLGVLLAGSGHEVLGPDIVHRVAEDECEDRSGLHPVSRLHRDLGDDAVHDGAETRGAPLVEAHHPDRFERLGPGHFPHRGGGDAGGRAACFGHRDDPGRGIRGGGGRSSVFGPIPAGEAAEQDQRKDGGRGHGRGHGRGASPRASRAAMAAATASIWMSFSSRRASA